MKRALPGESCWHFLANQARFKTRFDAKRITYRSGSETLKLPASQLPCSEMAGYCLAHSACQAPQDDFPDPNSTRSPSWLRPRPVSFPTHLEAVASRHSRVKRSGIHNECRRRSEIESVASQRLALPSRPDGHYSILRSSSMASFRFSMTSLSRSLVKASPQTDWGCRPIVARRVIVSGSFAKLSNTVRSLS